MFSLWLSLLFSAVFVTTAALSVWHIAADWTERRNDGGRGVSILVGVNHLVMSVCMLLMTWMPAGTVGTWTQVALFAVLAVGLLASACRAPSAALRIDLSGHVLLNGAMIWMLLAMPVLMGHMPGSGSASAHHGNTGSDEAMAPMAPAPDWMVSLNWAGVAVCSAIAVWWLAQVIIRTRHRVHALCHLLMSAGMALMLALM